MKIENWLKTSFIVFIGIFVFDMFFFIDSYSPLSIIWILCGVLVFILSIITLTKKPKHKAFPIVALVLSSIVALLFVFGIILGVLMYAL